VSRLGLPYNRFLKSSAWLLTEFNRDVAALRSGGLTTKSFGLRPEMATLRLHDDWARFCREIILASAVNEPKTINDIVVPRALGVSTRDDAKNVAIRSTHLGRYEPKWATASEAIRAAVQLRLSNLGVITAALGAVNSPAEDFRHVRNFFAHRAENTAAKVRALSFYSPGMDLNAEILLAQNVPGGITRFESWVIGLRTIALAAIQ
jgi:hypothetical protein